MALKECQRKNLFKLNGILHHKNALVAQLVERGTCKTISGNPVVAGSNPAQGSISVVSIYAQNEFWEPHNLSFGLVKIS